MVEVKQNVKKKIIYKNNIKLLSCYSAVHQVPFVRHKQTTCINYYKLKRSQPGT